MCVQSGAQERVGNGKVVSVGGRCGCEIKSCLFFLTSEPVSIPLPSFSALSPLELVFLTGFALMERNDMKPNP